MKRVTLLVAAATASISLALLVGCGKNASPLPEGPDTWLYHKRAGASPVLNYIERYGNDYEVVPLIEKGRLYQVLTWYTKGVELTVLDSTGDIVKETAFDPNSHSKFSTQPVK